MKTYFLSIFIIIYFFSLINCYDGKEDYTAPFLNKIKIGLEPKEINMIVNTLSSETVLFTNSGRAYYNEIKKGKKNNKIIRGIELNGELINQFTFNLKEDDTNLNNKKIQGEFGLGINKQNSSDLIETLFDKEVIYYKALELITDKKENIINFNFEPRIKDFIYCDLSPKKNYDLNGFYHDSWICDLSHIFVGSMRNELLWDKAIEVGAKAAFDSRAKYIFMPKAYMKYITKAWEMNINKCKLVRNLRNDDKYYSCSRDIKSDIYSMKSIYFVIGGYGYRLKPEDLFEDDGINLNCLIRFMDDGEDVWVMGIPFFRAFNVLLDYHEGKIGFKGEDIINYSQEYQEWIKKVKEDEEKMLEMPTGEKIFAIIGTIIGIGVLIYAAFYFYREYRREKPKYHIGLNEQNDINQKYI